MLAQVGPEAQPYSPRKIDTEGGMQPRALEIPGRAGVIA